MYVLGIEAFLAIVSTQNLTKAAEILHISQSSVSQRLKALEQDLGFLLIERNRGMKKITLTPQGEEFILLAEKWNHLWQETQSLQRNPSLSLAVGAVDSMNTYVLPAIYDRMLQRSPNLRLRVITDHSNGLYDLMDRKAIDVAFVLHEREVKNLDISPFVSEAMVVLRLKTPDTLLAPRVHPHDLDPEEEIRHDWFPAYQIWHNRWWDPLKSSRVFVSTGPMVTAMLQTSSCWAVVPRSIARSAEASGKFSIQELTDPPPDRVCYKLLHKFAKASTQKALAMLEEALAL
ncbi:MAG: LysR family transcriptional regulator [Negativicutes bacterium]|nr:LysR family transcriptional regulator [Negativicutes bacterium]